MTQSMSRQSIMLGAEFGTLFILLPLALFYVGNRTSIYLALWGAALFAFLMLWHAPRFSWRTLWHGDGWTKAQKRYAFLRFLLLAVFLAGITLLVVPERFMRFPLDHFSLWLAVMVLYPLISIVPQEILFRSFYFARYSAIIPEKPYGLFVNGLLFGFSHIVLNNWIAPTFCAVGGFIFAQSYMQHRSLKWAVIEHSFYGCWVFTVGIGWYFFTGNMHH